MQDLIKELTGYMFRIETFDKDAAQDGQALHAYLIELSNTMARANFLMAEYKMKFRKEKAAAYFKLAASQTATQKFYHASLAKDFIDAQCSDTGYIYDLSERLSRLCSHVSDAVRTIISSLKSERQMANYGG